MKNTKQYWKSSSGESTDIDELTTGQLKNILKMIVRINDQNRYLVPTIDQDVINSQLLLEERINSLITQLKIKNKEYSEKESEENYYRRETTLEIIQLLKETL